MLPTKVSFAAVMVSVLLPSPTSAVESVPASDLIEVPPKVVEISKKPLSMTLLDVAMVPFPSIIKRAPLLTVVTPV
jgi:hypothetical protein